MIPLPMAHSSTTAAVHDSEGLAILNGNGERLWRPLTNPRKLQTSAFVDRDPKGFGLSQRDRSFQNFEDFDDPFQPGKRRFRAYWRRP